MMAWIGTSPTTRVLTFSVSHVLAMTKPPFQMVASLWLPGTIMEIRVRCFRCPKFPDNGTALWILLSEHGFHIPDLPT